MQLGGDSCYGDRSPRRRRVIDLHGDLISGDPPQSVAAVVAKAIGRRAPGRSVAAALLTAMLAGCATPPRPVVSDGRYEPVPDGPNMRIVQGQVIDQSPLLPEPGDIWAGIVPDGVPGRPGIANAKIADLPTMHRAETSVPPAAGDQAKSVATVIAMPDRPAAAAKPPASQKASPGASPEGVAAEQPGQVTVQLLSAESQAEARGAWTWLEQRLPKALTGRAPQVVAGQVDGHPVWRLLTGGFANQTEANGFCDQVRDVGAQCKLVNDGV
jgi:hypothetical protein